jgi:3-hydroxy-9,10-secoandrosta-1,3,5(10)-triene-9,17-dione monooxygenase
VILHGNGPQGLLFILVPKQDYRIEDTWFVAGLRGTGSKDIVVDNAFVPEYRVVPAVELQDANSPGRAVHDTPNYRIPSGSMLPYTLAAPIIGMARGALDAYEGYMRDRIVVRTGERMARMVGVQLRIGEAKAEVDAARLIMQEDGRQVFAFARRNEMPSLEDRARYRRNQSYVAKLCVRAVNRIYEASGGHALYDSSPIQRFHRDAHAASHHSGLSWDTAAEQYGRIRLGLEPTDTSRT